MSDEGSKMTPQETSYRSAELVYREEADGTGGILEGRMIPYQTWTEIRSSVEGHFMERVMPGTFTKTLSEGAAKLRVLFEHGFSRLLDKQSIAQLEGIREEDDGPYYRAALLPGLPELLTNGLKRGLYGTSVAMRPLKGESWKPKEPSDYNPDRLEERSITEASLREISVVSFPAYEGATASVRSLTDEFVAARLLDDGGVRLLEIVRSLQAEEEPTHSEPPVEEDPPAERGAGPLLTPKPSRDWLSNDQEVVPWHIP